jgi:hypothetical protein
MSVNNVNGIFVQASEEQLAEIWEACAAHGFPLDSKGILELIMLAIHGDEDDDEPEEIAPDPVSTILNHFANNPQQAAALKDAGAKLFQKLFQKPR